MLRALVTAAWRRLLARARPATGGDADATVSFRVPMLLIRAQSALQCALPRMSSLARVIFESECC